jgi:hypothetical protein
MNPFPAQWHATPMLTQAFTSNIGVNIALIQKMDI